MRATVRGLPVTFRTGLIGLPTGLQDPVENRIICAPHALSPVTTSLAADGESMK